jgi:hypothetical protein
VQLGREPVASLQAGETLTAYVVVLDASGAALLWPTLTDLVVNVTDPSGTLLQHTPELVFDRRDLIAEPPRRVSWAQVVTVHSSPCAA